MISQIPKLGDKYADWVNMPVDRPLKLFHSPLIESLTKVTRVFHYTAQQYEFSPSYSDAMVLAFGLGVFYCLYGS